MFDTPHPAHKPPDPDRLAPSEARGVVTDVDWTNIAPVAALLRTHNCFDDDQDTDIGRPMLDALTTLGWIERTQRSPAMWTITGTGTSVIEAALRARESAPAVEREPVMVIGADWQLLWIDPVPLSEIVVKHGLTIGTKLYTQSAPPSVATGCAGENYRPVNINDVHAIDDSVFVDGPCPIDRELLEAMRSIGAVVPAVEAAPSQPACAAGEI